MLRLVYPTANTTVNVMGYRPHLNSEQVAFGNCFHFYTFLEDPRNAFECYQIHIIVVPPNCYPPPYANYYTVAGYGRMGR